MINVAFWYDRPVKYTGGLNYLSNLLYAISTVEPQNVKPYIFFGSQVERNVIHQFERYATVVTTPFLDTNTPLWFASKVLFKLTGSLYFLNRIFSKYDIQVVSHADDIYGNNLPYKTVNWFPDFQPLHLPHLFPNIDIKQYKNRIKRISKLSDVIILSSRSAQEDFLSIAPEFSTKSVVIPFVSQPQTNHSVSQDRASIEVLCKKYEISNKYFFLPNQFWKHKNHQVVFEAVKILKSSGKNVFVVCTGNFLDYRHEDNSHAESLFNFINCNSLSENIKLLGLIDYEDVLSLMRNSISVINPSLFEGWSSSVEEAKSLGKHIILSNIPVHKEQAPAECMFFSPDNPSELAVLLENAWNEKHPGPDPVSEKAAQDSLLIRTLSFGRSYEEVILRLFQQNISLKN